MPNYEPTPDQEKVISEIDSKFERWRSTRQPHESQWFLNSAFERGLQYVEWNSADARLTSPPAPRHRVRLTINRIMPKAKARRAKALKNRPMPIVVAASPEQNDQLDARASTKALEFQHDRLMLEKKSREALLWAERCGRGFWWFYWDPSVTARVLVKDPVTGAEVVQESELGDVCVEVGSAFEVLVADPSAHSLALQPEIMRVKLRPLDEVKARYPEFAEYLRPESGDKTAFRYEQQISKLTPAGTVGGAGMLEDRKGTAKGEDHDLVLMKEHFIRPNGRYPKGAYRLLAGKVLLISREELPYGFHDMQNPFPVTEFVDVESVGQYWSTTMIEQLIGIQREYNLVRSKVAEQLRLMAFPKLLAAKQHNIPNSAWTSEAGEFVEYLAIPGIPPPQPWHPPNIAADAWRAIDLIKTEFDDITQVYPAAEGKVAGATSGFQTNLLQEATDLVHAPDIRNFELSLEEAYQKIRRIMKIGYTEPRLLTVIGRHYEPEVIEFSESQINEYAKVRIQTGSMLPDLKAARIDAGMNLFKSGIMGDPGDPAVRRRVLSLIDAGSVEESVDIARADESQARLENNEFEKGRPLPMPEFYEDHQTHYETHTYKLKSPEARGWPKERRLQFIAHILEHMFFINPTQAVALKQQYGLIPPPQPAAQMGPSPMPPGMEMPMGMGPATPPAPPLESSQAQGMNVGPQPPAY
jgi:hypothetical protein